MGCGLGPDRRSTRASVGLSVQRSRAHLCRPGGVRSGAGSITAGVLRTRPQRGIQAVKRATTIAAALLLGGVLLAPGPPPEPSRPPTALRGLPAAAAAADHRADQAEDGDGASQAPLRGDHHQGGDVPQQPPRRLLQDLHQVPGAGRSTVRVRSRPPRASSTTTSSTRTCRACTGSPGSSRASGSAAGSSGCCPPVERLRPDCCRAPGASMLVVGFDTATDDTAVCAWRGRRGPATSRVVGLAAGRDPARARDRAAAGGRARRGGGRRLGAGGRGSPSGSAPARSPACGSGSPPRGRWRRRSGCRRSASARSTRSPLGIARGRGGRARAAGRARRADGGEVFAALYAAGGAADLRSRCLAGPSELAEFGSRLSRTPSGRRFGGGTISATSWPAAASEIPDDSDPVHRVAARHVCALGGSRCREDGAARPDLPETPRRGTVA